MVTETEEGRASVQITKYSILCPSACHPLPRLARLSFLSKDEKKALEEFTL
jgi:hypothetical protein